MEKIEKTVIVQEESYYDDDFIEVSKFIELINAAVAKGATYINMYSEYDSSQANIQFLYKRMETDAELATRIKVAENYKKQEEQRERKEYERLKKKFDAQ